MAAHVDATFRPLPTGGELKLARRYRQPVEKVWAALSTPGRIAEWMGVEWLSGDLPLSEGAPFDYRFHDSDLESRGKMLRFEPPNLLEHSWFDNLPSRSVVRWSLAADGGGTILTLTHVFQEPEDAPRTGAGWTQILETLAASMGEERQSEGGVEGWRAQRDRYADAFPPEATRDGRLAKEDGKPALRFERLLARPVDEVWVALTEPERIARWLTRAEVEPRVAGRFHLNFKGGDSVVDGRIMRWEPPRLLEYTWPEKEANGSSLVRFELFPAGAGTRLILTHRLDAGGDLADFASRWHWHLNALDRALEGESVAFDEPRWRLLRKVYEMTLPAR
ncbi:MAG: toxin-antitoxin system toxin subunit [Alphaproteobacteria bacterium]|nr:toxin-antitoxin system toxin subunit [Alphaproteobacteria bacterium]